MLTLTGALTLQLPCVADGISTTGTDLIEVKSASGAIGAPGTLFDFNCAPPHPLSVGAMKSSTCGVEVIDTLYDDGGNITWELEPGGSVAGDAIDMTATSVTSIDDNTMYAVSGHGGFTLLGTDGSTLVGSVTF
jgi:hypothetical protein